MDDIAFELQKENRLLAEINQLRAERLKLRNDLSSLRSCINYRKECLLRSEEQLEMRKKQAEEMENMENDSRQHFDNLAVEIYQSGMDFHKEAIAVLAQIDDRVNEQLNNAAAGDLTGSVKQQQNEELEALEAELEGKLELVRKLETRMNTKGEGNLVSEISLEDAKVLTGR